jgi:hypothetical protein
VVAIFKWFIGVCSYIGGCLFACVIDGTYGISLAGRQKDISRKKMPGPVEYHVGLEAGARKEANAQERSGWAQAAGTTQLRKRYIWQDSGQQRKQMSIRHERALTAD